MRLKNIQDNATPSGNSLAVMSLLQLALYGGVMKWQETAEKVLSVIVSGLLYFSLDCYNWLCALNYFTSSTKEITLLLPNIKSDLSAYNRVLWSTYRADCIVAPASYPPAPASPKLLHDRPLINNRTSVYVCHNFVCEMPVETPEQLADKLK
jgi:uncharacterized protein YyaL (SSP411 family)